MTIYFLSTPIVVLPEGNMSVAVIVDKYDVENRADWDVAKAEIRKVVRKKMSFHNIICAVSHRATVDLLNEALYDILGVMLEPSRQPVTLSRGDVAIAIKPEGRPQPGKEFTVDDLFKLGFSVYIMSVTAMVRE